MSEVLVELLRQAHYLLKPGGRLVRDISIIFTYSADVLRT